MPLFFSREVQIAARREREMGQKGVHPPSSSENASQLSPLHASLGVHSNFAHKDKKVQYQKKKKTNGGNIKGRTEDEVKRFITESKIFTFS